MKILIGCDVDPVLPPLQGRRPIADIWRCLDHLERLTSVAKDTLPPITWLLRCDESVKLATGELDSGYTIKRSFWQRLLASGHELGWHMHLMSFDDRSGSFEFDPDPEWLSEACHALARHFEVRSTRTGWDYGSNSLFRRLDALGILVDFSALPGNLAWFKVGHGVLAVDWSRCPVEPYHPCADDYQRPGNLHLLEIPILSFPNSPSGIARRFAVRLKNGRFSTRGLRHCTRTITDAWGGPPTIPGPVAALYFHPEDLAGDGLHEFLRNLQFLRSLPEVEFVTASAARNLFDHIRIDTSSRAANRRSGSH